MRQFFSTIKFFPQKKSSLGMLIEWERSDDVSMSIKNFMHEMSSQRITSARKEEDKEE
jgi:hypothetical protein